MKDEITAAVWPGSGVEDSDLVVQIWALRRVLDRGQSNGSCSQTVAGRGYRFAARVTGCGADPPPAVCGNGEDRGAVARPASGTRARPRPWRQIAAYFSDLRCSGPSRRGFGIIVGWAGLNAVVELAEARLSSDDRYSSISR